MGSSQSYPGLTEDVLEDLRTLTYLSKGEILYLMKRLKTIDEDKIVADYHHRFTKEEIIETFDVLKYNPFQDRIFSVFSSKKDNCFSFEDLVDLYSVMSSECPCDVKAAWAFRLFDINEDNQICAKDICSIIDRITSDQGTIDDDSKEKIAKGILQELSLNSNGTIGMSEFKLSMSRIPEFETSFYFKL